MAEATKRTPAAKPQDAEQAKNDGRDNSTSVDPNVRATTEGETTTTDNSNITEGGKIATHRDEVDANHPGFHCGYCGEPVGPEGQHWDKNGNQVEGGHAGTLVVANNWPENQDAQDAEKREQEQAQRNEINGITEE